MLYGDLVQLPEFRLLRDYAVQGKTVPELAEQEHISTAVCYKRIARARKLLQKKIKK